MKKYLPFMLSAAMVMPMVACGGGEDDPNNQQNNSNNNNNNGGNRPNGNNNGQNNSQTSVISRINQGQITVGQEIKLSDVIITALQEYTSKNADTGKYEVTGIPGFYVSDVIDQAAPYTGLYIKLSGNAEPGAFAIGDRIDVSGVVAEYYGAIQLGTATATKLSTGTLPKPVVISDPATIGTVFEYNENGGYYAPSSTVPADAKKYAGVLVKVENVSVTNDAIKSLKSNCADPSATPVASDCLASTGFEVASSLVVGNKNMYYVPNALRKKGQKFKSITGILDLSYSAYQLFPTTADDVVKDGGASDNTDADTDNGNNNNREYTDAEIGDILSGDVAKDTFVKINGTVVSHTSAPFDNSLSFYVADENGNAILAYSASVDNANAVTMGKEVTVTGSVYHMTTDQGNKYTQIEVKGAGKPAVTVTGDGSEDSVTVTLPVNESNKGKLATFTNLTVKEAADDYCTGGTTKTNYCTATLADSDGNTIKVKYLKLDNNDKHYGNLKTLIGDNFSNEGAVFAKVTGILDVSYGDLVLFPRSQNDIVRETGSDDQE